MSVNPWLKCNKKNTGEIKIAVSQGYIDEETGEIRKMTLVPVSAERAHEIQEECYISNPNGVGKRLDTDKYTDGLIAETVVDPDFRDKELQESFEAKNAVQCMNRMLNAGEKATLTMAINKMYRISPEFLVEEVKEAKNA